jgi:hypothetical protein
MDRQKLAGAYHKKTATPELAAQQMSAKQPTPAMIIPRLLLGALTFIGSGAEMD